MVRCSLWRFICGRIMMKYKTANIAISGKKLIRPDWEADVAFCANAEEIKGMCNLVILISGRGSNMQALVRARAQEQWPARIQAVISDRADAPGLAFAAAQRIRTVVVEARAHTRASFEAALMEAIDALA